MSWAVLSTYAQDERTSTIMYISEVPLIIESSLFVDSLTNNEQFHAVSGMVKVALAPRTVAVLSDIYVRAGKPLPVEQTSRLEYRWIFNGKITKEWMQLAYGAVEFNKFPYAGVLLDTTLRTNETVILQFRFQKSRDILQQNIFNKPELLPSVIRYRQKYLYDSIDNRIESRVGTDEKERWLGFDTMKGNTIEVSPGKYLEMVFKNNSLNRDSCILFQLHRNDGQVDSIWRLTGHLLALTGIESKNEYILDVRYPGMQAFNRYRVSVRPFWYQTSQALTVFVIVGLMGTLGIPYLSYRYLLKVERRKRIRIQEQLKTVQSQLNPHFVYNALNSIEALVTNKENDRANEYLSSFSDIMRETLRNSDVLFTSLSEDIEMLEKYISIEQLRFEFRFVVEIDPSLDLNAIEFPPMLLQPSVENAVKHGVSGKGVLGIIKLSFHRRGSDLVVTIEDNGPSKANRNTSGNGLGTSFTRERVESLKKLYRKQKIEYQMDHTAKGTLVTFYFENWI